MSDGKGPHWVTCPVAAFLISTASVHPASKEANAIMANREGERRRLNTVFQKSQLTNTAINPVAAYSMDHGSRVPQKVPRPDLWKGPLQVPSIGPLRAQ